MLSVIASIVISFVSVLRAQHLGQLQEVVGSPEADEEKDVEEDGPGYPRVGRSQFGISGSTQLKLGWLD